MTADAGAFAAIGRGAFAAIGRGAFAPAARRLAGQAGALLGWSPDRFWRATPADLGAVVEALTGGAAVAPLDGGLLARLQEAFPDG